jgi:hypothetical protein
MTDGAYLRDDPMCPLCGRRVGDRTYPGEPLCTPLSCDMWDLEAVYNYETRRWEAERLSESGGP